MSPQSKNSILMWSLLYFQGIAVLCTQFSINGKELKIVGRDVNFFLLLCLLKLPGHFKANKWWNCKHGLDLWCHTDSHSRIFSLNFQMKGNSDRFLFYKVHHSLKSQQQRVIEDETMIQANAWMCAISGRKPKIDEPMHNSTSYAEKSLKDYQAQQLINSPANATWDFKRQVRNHQQVSFLCKLVNKSVLPWKNSVFSHNICIFWVLCFHHHPWWKNCKF